MLQEKLVIPVIFEVMVKVTLAATFWPTASEEPPLSQVTER
jgi:hypothetical protein